MNYDDAINKTIVTTPKKEWHPKYEKFGKKTRALSKSLLLTMIPYMVWGALFWYAYERGSYPALAISIALSILYTLKTNGKEYKLQ